MTRIANAKLIFDVEDDKLDPHIQRVREAKTQWEALGATFEKVTGSDMNAIKGLLSAFATEIGKVASASGKMKWEPFVTAATTLDGVLIALNPKLATLTTTMEKVAPLFDQIALASSKWSKSLQSTSSVIDRLKDRLESLGEAQLKSDENLRNFSTQLMQANDALKNQGQEMLKVLQAFAGFNKAVTVATQAQKQGEKATVSWWNRLRDMERAFIRHSTVLFILQHQIEGVIRAFTEAATQTDLTANLNKSITGFADKLEAARQSTRNTISDLELLKSAALMSSFGLDMSGTKFAENMEMVQKLAIRTGQDAGYLADSFARGISRLSPAILDNLGMQIKLKDAYEAYAASIGVATDKLDAQQKKAAVLNEVLRQGAEITADVDPAASYVARIQQAQARISNFFNGLKQSILGVLVDMTAQLDERVGMSLDKVAIRLKEIRELGLPKSEEGKNAFIEDDQVTAMLMALGKLQGGSRAWLETMSGMKEVVGDFFYGNFTPEQLERLQEWLKQTEFLAQLNRGSMLDLANATYHYMDLLDKRKKLEQDVATNRHGVGGSLYARRLQKVNQEIAKYDTLLNNARQSMDTVWVAWTKIEQARKGLKKEAELIFPDDTAAQTAWINTMDAGLKGLRETVKDITSDPNFHMLTFIPGLGMEGKLKALREEATKTTQATNAEHLKRNRAQLATLAMLDQEVERVQLLAGHARDLTDREVQLSLLKKDVNKTQSEYNEMREKLIILNAEEGKYTVQDLEAKKEQLDKLYRAQAAMEARVNLEKDFAKALNDTSVLSKDLRAAEAERLAGNRSRNQLEAEYVNLRIEHAIAMEVLAEATAHYYEVLYQGSSLEADLAANELEEAERKLTALKASIIENRNLLAAMPRATGGGGKEKDKAFKWKPFAIREVTSEMLKQYFVSGVAENGDLVLSAARTEIKKIFDQFGNLLREEAETSGEIFSAGAKTPTGMAFGFIETLLGQDLDAALEHNATILKAAEDFVAQGGILGPDALSKINDIMLANDAMRDHLELLKDISSVASDLATGISNAFAGGADLIGEDWLNALDGLTTGLSNVAEAAENNADAYGLITAGLPALRGFTKEFVKDLKTRAFFEMLMNAAAAWAAFPNVPKMVAHGTAASIYGLVAGGVIKLPSKATEKGDKDDKEKKTGMAPINVYLYGEMIMSEGQLGVTVEQGIQQARAEGRL